MKALSRRETIALTTAAVGTTPSPRPAKSGSIPNRSGLNWASGARTSNIDSFVVLRKGRPLDLLVNFGGRSTWIAMRNRYKSLQPLLDPTQGNRQETIVITYPIFPDNELPRIGGDSVWAAAARGDFDFHHKVIADNLKRYRQKFIFRVGHEWNCCYPWRCLELGLAPNYIAYFRRIVDILRERHPTCLIHLVLDQARQDRGEHR